MGPELNEYQQTVHSTQKATVGATKIKRLFKQWFYKDINFSLVENMSYTKLMYR